MKRIVVYYSLSGNTEEVAKKIANELGADILKVDTAKPMPKAFIAQILVGGGQVAMNKVPEIMPIEKNMADYDEIILGTPIWNSKGVPAINAFLNLEGTTDKVKYVFFTSGGGDIDKAVDALKKKLPNLKNSVSLLDRKNIDFASNEGKIKEFIGIINA